MKINKGELLIMFGYQEENYKVLDSIEFSKEETKSFQQIIELRETENKNLSYQYISILGLNDKDEVVLDVLLFYRNNTKQDLENDWDELRTNIETKLEDLRAFNWVKNHHIGYSKDGEIIMF